MKAVRYLTILSLIASMNFSGQKMLQIFKQKVTYVMYACLALAFATGCATTEEQAETKPKRHVMARHKIHICSGYASTYDGGNTYYINQECN